MQLATPNRRALAAAVKAHLKSNQLSFSKFAEKSGINPNTISRLTQPDKFDRVQSETRKKLVSALGTSWDALIRANGNGHAAPQVVHRANGHVKPANDSVARNSARRMIVIDLCGSRVTIPAGFEVSIMDETTIRVR